MDRVQITSCLAAASIFSFCPLALKTFLAFLGVGLPLSHKYSATAEWYSCIALAVAQASIMRLLHPDPSVANQAKQTSCLQSQARPKLAWHTMTCNLSIIKIVSKLFHVCIMCIVFGCFGKLDPECLQSLQCSKLTRQFSGYVS